MATLTLKLTKLRFPSGSNLTQAITASLYYKEYYAADFILIDDVVPIALDGTIMSSPLPTVLVDPTKKYIIKAVNDLCGFSYEQILQINAYCPAGYDLAPDYTFCYIEEIVDATAPSAGEVTAPRTAISYSTCGSYIYNAGYNVNGTGASTQITIANGFWCNGGTCVDNNTTDGPLNRCGLWATTVASNQDVGFAVCFDIAVKKTYYVGIACDNYGIIKLDGVVIIQQDAAALGTQYGVGPNAAFKVWHIYPIEIETGPHVLECIGHNDSGVAAMGVEIYNNTPAEIIAATSYAQLNLIFSSKDYRGQPVQLGSGGLGFSCPEGFSLQSCSSPYMCVKLSQVPVFYGA